MAGHSKWATTKHKKAANDAKRSKEWAKAIKNIEVAAQTGSYEAILPLINMNFDGLKAAILTMLSGSSVKVRVNSFQNDMVTFKNKDDVLTLLIHLGYLGYDQKQQMAFIPNEEIRTELADAVEETRWNEWIEFQQESNHLLEATLDMEAETVSEGIEKILRHTNV